MRKTEQQIIQQLQEEKELSERLLCISEDVAKITDRKELFQTIFDRLKPLFHFDDAVINLKNEDGISFIMIHSNQTSIAPENPHYQKFIQKNILIENSPYEEIFTYKSPRVNLRAYYQKQYPEFPGVKLVKEMQYSAHLVVPIATGTGKVGVLEFHSKNEDTFQNIQEELLKGVADQMSVAVSNVLTNEQLLREKQFTEELLSISQALVEVGDRKELFHIIHEKIGQLLPMDDLAIVILNEEGTEWKDISIERGLNQDKITKALTSKGFDQWLEMNSLIEHFISTTEVMSISDYKQFDFPTEFVQILEEGGLIEYMHTPLRLAGKAYGALIFDSKTQGIYTEKDFPLFQAITDQLAVAVSNVLASEQLIEEKQFKETLLGISEAVASIQDRKELFRVIFEKIQPLMNFDDFGLFNLDETGKYHRDLSVTDEHLAIHKQVKDARINEYLPHDDSVDIFIQEGPMVLSLEALIARFPGHPYYPFMQQEGLKQILGGPLTYQGKHIGMLAFNSKQQDFYSEKDFSLFQAIADQLAVAVSNVLANERLLEEKQFSETLLEITESIANINRSEDLVTAIFDKLQQVYPFDDAGLIVIDWKNERERDLMVDFSYNTTGLNVELNEMNLLGWQPLTSLSRAVSQQSGKIMSTKELYATFDHPHFEIVKQSNFEQLIFGELTQGDTVIGALTFWSKQEGRFTDADVPIFRSIAGQLSVALANVLANEQIVLENQQKQLQLKVAEAISQARSVDALLREVIEHVSPIFSSQEHALIIIDEEKDEYRDLAVLHHEVAGSDLFDAKYFDLGLYTTRKVPYKGSQLEACVLQCERNGGQPMVFNYNLDYKGFTDRVLLEELKKDLSEAVLVPLKASGKIFGVFLLAFTEGNHFDQQQLSLFKSISDQLAIAVSNALANDDIQQREQEETLKAKLVNALNAGDNWSAKLLPCARALARDFPFHLVSFGLIGDTVHPLNYGFERIGPDEFRMLDIPSFLQMTGLQEADFQQGVLQNKPLDPVYDNSEDFFQAAKKNVIKKVMHQFFGIQSSLIFPLRIEEDKCIYISFYSKHASAWHQEHLQLMEAIAPSFQLAFEKQLAYQEIEALNSRLQEEKEYLIEEVQTEHNYQNIIGNSPVMLRLFQQIEQIAPYESTVLLQGETGTGKELIARAIHSQSGRTEQLLVKVNCAALPENLIESELFGHEKGAFTGALKQRIGKFELANKGTIFLDEIGELPLALQAKLLRVLQEKEFERLRSNQTFKTDCRVIAATNRDLQTEVQAGNFREDLYYRLSVFPLVIPALRERRDDIALLANFFAQRFCKKMGKPFQGFAPDVLAQLLNYSFPGNVRELENLMEQSVILQQGDLIQLARPLMLASPSPTQPVASLVAPAAIPASPAPSAEEVERNRILAALRQTKGRVAGENGAAKLLGIKATTLDYRIKRLGLFEEMKMIKAGG